MKAQELLHSWSTILSGRKPLMSIEITRECPLRCPGCYAYDDAHLGGNGVTLRVLSDYKQDELVVRMLALVDEHRPLHVSIVGGDPMVRYRELEKILPELDERGIHVQLVTSAFRPIPMHWTKFTRLNVVVSIDGLQPDHDERRKPATYERILKNIQGSRVTIHSTITGQMMKREGYFEEFLAFWSKIPEIKRIWMSIFTPQHGAVGPEILTPEERVRVIGELGKLRTRFPVLDMSERVLREFLHPPKSPDECIFARTTEIVSADLKTRVTPCQFGGNPDCSQCGCMASMGLAAVGHLEIGGIGLGKIFRASERIGRGVDKLRNSQKEVA
ncbi:radical SAM protein [Acidobacterium sp. S8]|uniref:radical SAM protein n=1 Tax=Acidobacterium sp. S8 TaxID=1641854 RepID=UPI00131CF5BB|nr:radical SAM protein [Acidobacterium sp. S8]